MRQVPSTPDTIVLGGEFERFSPEELYDHLTQPNLLQRWWAKVAETDLEIGGAYHLAWPAMEWHLRGEYTALERGVHLGYTWKWGHDPSPAAPQQVDFWLESLGEGGTRLGIYHGPFASTPAGQDDRKGTAEGWLHFAEQLRALRP